MKKKGLSGPVRAAKRVLTDFLTGENVTPLVTLILTVTAGALFFFNVNTRITTPVLFIAIQAALFTIIGNRFRLDDILKELRDLNQHKPLSEMPDSLKGRIKSAEEIWIVGVDIADYIARFGQELEQIVSRKRAKTKLRVIVLDPQDDNLVRMAASRRDGDIDITHQGEQAEIKLSIEAITNLKVKSNNIEIRTIKHLLPYSAILIDPKKTNGLMCLRYYYHKNSEKAYILYSRENDPDTFWIERHQEEICEHFWSMAKAASTPKVS